jgi:hypothetical protein
LKLSGFLAADFSALELLQDLRATDWRGLIPERHVDRVEPLDGRGMRNPETNAVRCGGRRKNAAIEILKSTVIPAGARPARGSSPVPS